ncbi:unnamed protein product [Cyclocybe aegerita]|uniref:Uncharacterized protein n=1 Tax=Cyclocybe aegerita TaxID=1973307 RepID=A0A8S0WQM1_CYCAE|nr:unnamed protein product [Cyclocybe aegerita]
MAAPVVPWQAQMLTVEWSDGVPKPPTQRLHYAEASVTGLRGKRAIVAKDLFQQQDKAPARECGWNRELCQELLECERKNLESEKTPRTDLENPNECKQQLTLTQVKDEHDKSETDYTDMLIGLNKNYKDLTRKPPRTRSRLERKAEVLIRNRQLRRKITRGARNMYATSCLLTCDGATCDLLSKDNHKERMAKYENRINAEAKESKIRRKYLSRKADVAEWRNIARHSGEGARSSYWQRGTVQE